MGISLMFLFSLWPFYFKSLWRFGGGGSNLYQPFQFCRVGEVNIYRLPGKKTKKRITCTLLTHRFWFYFESVGGGSVWNLEGLGGENHDLPVEPFLPVCLRVQREMSRPNRTTINEKKKLKKNIYIYKKRQKTFFFISFSAKQFSQGPPAVTPLCCFILFQECKKYI